MFKTFKPFNRFAPFKPFKAGIESRIPTKLCLKFTDDRRRYLHWLFEAKKRFGLCVLDYMVTSNHIHLLVKDTGPDVIAKSMQLTKTETRSKRSNRSIASLRSRRFTSEHQSIRDVVESDGSYALREPAEAYAGNLNDKTEALRHQNTFVWDEKVGDART